MRGAPNANSDAPIINTNMTVDITKAVVTAMAATGFDAQLSGCKIKLVMEHENIIGINLVKPRNLGNW